jgi:hypothetical protein
LEFNSMDVIMKDLTPALAPIKNHRLENHILARG